MSKNTLSTQLIEQMFPSPEGHQSRAYWIPMSLYKTISQAYRDAGVPVRARFRGPRLNQVGLAQSDGRGGYYLRGYVRAMQDCLKDYATHFSIYSR